MQDHVNFKLDKRMAALPLVLKFVKNWCPQKSLKTEICL